MKVLIVGKSGFLGTSLENYFLKKGYNVYALSYRPELADEFSTKLQKLISSKKINIIINASADQNPKDELDDLENLISSNIYLPCILSKSLLLEGDGLLINFGSSWEYLEDKISPYNAYAASKSAINNFFKHFSLKGINIASLALSDTYGFGDKRKKILNLMINALKNNKQLEMTGGNQEIDLVHVDDVCLAVEHVILNKTKLFLHDNFQTFRIASGERLKVRELVELFYSLSKKNSQNNLFKLGIRDYHERERFNLEFFTPNLPGWKPFKKLKSELKRMLDYKK